MVIYNFSQILKDHYVGIFSAVAGVPYHGHLRCLLGHIEAVSHLSVSRHIVLTLPSIQIVKLKERYCQSNVKWLLPV